VSPQNVFQKSQTDKRSSNPIPEGSGEFKNSKDGFFGKRGTNSISPPKNEEPIKMGN
jgi:hypothetical protein